MLRIPAPETTHQLAGVTAYSYVVWFVSLSCGVFGFLFYYFHVHNCNINSIVVANLHDKSLYKAYNSGTNYLCNARMAFPAQTFHKSVLNGFSDHALSDLYCQLGDMPCDTYGRFREDLCSSTRCSATIVNMVYDPMTQQTTSIISEESYNCLESMVYDGGFDSRAYPSNMISIEYVSCEAVSTSLINALQYTTLAQLIGTILFLFVCKICSRFDLKVLCESSTYFNVLENRVVKHHDSPEDVSDRKDVEMVTQSLETSPEDSPLNVPDTTVDGGGLTDLVEHAAVALLRGVAPKSQYKLRGWWAGSFIFWYFASMAVVFSVLLWYFLEGGCTNQMTNTAKDLSASFYKEQYASGGNHLCSSKAATYSPSYTMGAVIPKDVSFRVPCLLKGMTCDDYAGIGTGNCVDKACDPHSHCEDFPASSVFIEYTQCIDLPVALMSAIQYAFIAETIALALYFLVRLVITKGVSVLVQSATYMDLWNNMIPEEFINEEEEDDKEVLNDVDVPLPTPPAKESEFQEILHYPSHAAAITANHVFQAVAPRSKVKLNGFCTSTIFIIWFVGSSAAMFSSLFWYFYESACISNSLIVDVSEDKTFYQNLFSGPGIYFCNSKLPSGRQIQTSLSTYNTTSTFTLECLLEGMTPADFEQSYLCPKGNIKGTDAFKMSPGSSCCPFGGSASICQSYCAPNEVSHPVDVYSVDNFETWTTGISV